MFAYRLALQLGCPHPDYLTARLSASQLVGWMRYAEIEPFGEFRHELRHGQVMALHSNINRDSKQRPEPFKALDFMNFVEQPPERKLTDAQIETELTKIFGA